MANHSHHRADYVLAQQLAGHPECYNWRNNRKGPFANSVVDRLVRGQALTLLELCGHPAFLPELYHRQIEIYIDDLLDVDLDYDDTLYTVPNLGRGRGPARSELPHESVEDLYDDYVDWCYSRPPYMEAVPRGAFVRALRAVLSDRCHGDDARRIRVFKDVDDAGDPVQRRFVMGVQLLSRSAEEIFQDAPD